MQAYRIRKGYDIPIQGKAKLQLGEIGAPSLFSVRPPEFHYVKPNLQVRQGDAVKVGTPLFKDKRRPEVLFVSPVTGLVREIRFGPRRRIDAILLEASSKGDDYERQASFRPGEIAGAQKSKIKEILLAGGMWPHIRQRPFDIIADPHKEPDAIFVNAMDTAPLAADPEFTMRDVLPDMKAGLEALGLFSQNLHLTIHGNRQSSKSIFENLSVPNLKIHSFRGPHPAGLVSTHIARISPLKAGRLVWYLNARDVAAIGSFLLTGQFPTERIVALAGTDLRESCYYKLRVGGSIRELLKHKLVSADTERRIISGNLLSGREISEEDSVGFYDDLLTVIPAGRERHFLRWMLPGLNRPSWSRAFTSSIFSLFGRRYVMNSNKNGELRALVKTGDYEKLLAVDVLPYFIVKSILAGDIELMEQLGIYEIAPEDFALCSYICPSKVEFSEILRSGLDLLLSENT